MSFLAPGAFLLGLLLPVIVALYLLKLRRVEREVPSTYLWRRMVRDVEANAPWQKLKPNLLLILQLLFLIALILAIARPFFWTEGAGGQAAILILDTSASMAATDVAPNRLESAKTRARQLVDDLPDNARVTIIEAGVKARVLISSSLDRRQAHLAIESAQVGPGGSDMTVALELASAIAARQPDTEIVVLSDGRVDLPQRLSLKGTLRYIPFGLNGENQAISLLTLEPSPGAVGLTAFAQVTNYGETAASRRLSLYADGLLVNAFDVNDIPAAGQKSIIVEGLPAATRQVEASLSGEDTLPLDDHAVAIRPDSRILPVTLVTRGNRFIKTALGLLPGVELAEQDPGKPPEGEAASGGTATPQPSATVVEPGLAGDTPPAIVIYDSVVPDELPASGSLLFIAPPRSTSYFSTTGLVEDPRPRVIDPTDPLLANVSLADVSVLDAIRIPLPDWAVPIVAGDLDDENVTLLFRGEVDERRVAVLAFDMRRSDLPLQVAFPLLWANLVDWLAPGARSILPAQVAPGENLSFPAPAGAQQATITRPDGSSIQVEAQNGRFIFADTSQLGSYLVAFHQEDENASTSVATAAFAVNLFSPQESFVDPADGLPGLDVQENQTGETTQLARREFWRPLALLALGLITGEWLVYHRAALARLLDFLRGSGFSGKRPLARRSRPQP